MKSIRYLLLAALAMFALHAQAALLFDPGDAAWRWRPGTNEASTPIPAWTTNGFNDAEFVNAPAPFWYGDVRAGGTQITTMQSNYLCIFLRKTFVLTNTAEIAGLRFNYFVDDGFVAWINGTEVFRENVDVTVAVPTIATLATNQAIDPAVLVTSPVVPAPGSLVVGVNVLAVQVIQSSLTSSDLGFDTSLEIITIETNPPTVLSANPSGGSTVGGLSSITVTFSEPVSGVDAADFLVNGVAATSVTPVSGAVYSFGFAQPAYGAVQITWNAGHGIADQALPPNPFNATGPGATWQYTLVDQTPPTVATLSPAPSATVRTLTNISVLFSENVTGVDAADLRINNTAATSVVGTGDTYSFYFPQPATGIVQVAWAASHGIKDLAAAPNAFVAGGTWLYTLDPNAGQSGGPIISEFMALNSANAGQTGFYPDEDGDSSDWIEIQNTSSFTVNLLNWSLTDEAGNLSKWQFPSTNLASGGFLVVFASGKNRRVPGAPLHTSFQIHGEGEYLALARPDGSIASEFAPMFPPQVGGVSYGLGVLSTNSTLVATSAAVRVRIPASGADGTNWLYVGFDDSSWTEGTNGVGFGTTNVTAADYSASVLPTLPLVYYRMSETAGTTAANLGSMGASGNGSYVSGPTLDTAGPRPPQFNGFEPNNRAVQFSGTALTDYIAGPAGLLTSRAAFTIAGWIRPTAAQAGRTGLFGQNDTVEFGFISAGTIQAWTPNGSIGAYTYPGADNEWHHIALVGAGGQFTIYLDGTSRISAAAVAGGAAGNFNIGGGGIFDATGNDYVGQMDEIAMWDRALSGSELLGLYTAGTTPAGFSVVPYVKTDVSPAMSNVNASAYLRLPFTIDDPSNVQLLTLKMRYDDGFVAFINGIEVARGNAPETLSFNSGATNTHSVATVDLFQLGSAVLRPGANVLAIQGLNVSSMDEDFLVGAELTATHNAAASGSAVYMTVPSPGTANGAGVSVLGPAIGETTHSPNVPSDAQDVLVTARVTPTFASIGSVVVRYRIMFGPDIELPMNDGGTNGDVVAGDGLYSGTLPIAATSTNGQMVRWYFRATDTLSRVSRWPLFLSTGEEEYLGTVVDPSYVTSQLPIFHLFIGPTQVAGIDTETGGRLSLFWGGELYDNIYMELRGNTSAGLPKKAHRLEFSREHQFRHPGPGGRVRKSSLLAEYPDPARIRQHLCFWFLDKIGVPSPFDYPVRVQTNGVFYQLAFHNDVIGQEQIERLGYDPKGALYKAAGNVKLDRASTGVFQKLEPDQAVPDYTDYNQVANGIVETATTTVRRAAVFDLFDVPEVISYLVGARWCSENDDVWANMSLYRDTYGDQLWRIIPFDMNASWGQRYGGNTPLEGTSDARKSHPLYGGMAIDPNEGPAAPNRYNRLYDVMIALPETREMMLRRMRSVMDRWIQPPGTPTNTLIIESYITQLTNLMAPDALLDDNKWPAYSAWGPVEPFITACTNIMYGFVGPRRQHWYGTHCITNTALITGTNATQKAGIPLAQPAHAPILVGAIEFNPASSNQLQEYICLTNPNPYAVDITGWKLKSGAEFTFKPGTVMPSNGVLYVSPNVVAFKQRTTGPRGGQGLFVVGPYSGQLNARGESILVYDDTGFLITSNSYIGAPSPAQQYLRITELMYNPSPLAGNTNDAQEFEYIELKNISASTTLDLNGVKFVNGVDFAFTGSAITSLAPGARALLVRNLPAFTARYGGGPPVAGQYTGVLDNAGERLQLLDNFNEEILDFSYNNTWYPVTDGYGFSLVVVDETAQPDMWGSKTNWRPSSARSGSPGVVDPPPPALAPIVINELLTHSGFPVVDAVELLNPTASSADISGWFLSDDFTNVFKYRFPNGTIIPAGGFLVVDENQFNNANAPATAIVPFAFSSSGDEARLSSGDATTNLTGYMTTENFGAAQTNVSFGRYTNSQGAVHFVAQAANSFNAPNGLPRVGPLVISEIMYHPPDLVTLFGTTDNDVDEFVELENITANSLPLYDPAAPTNTWRLRDAVDFTFPANVMIPPGGHVVVVSFNPSDAAAASGFRFRNGASSLTPLFGPWQGQLDNSSDSLELVRPNPPPPNPTNGISYFIADKVHYGDGSGWTAGADGTGMALQRVAASQYGNDPINWIASGRTPGFDPSSTNGPVITAQPQNASVLRGLSTMFSVTASGAQPIVYQWRFNGTPIVGATNSLLLLANVLASQAGQYSCLLENPAGVTVTLDATLTVVIPAEITQQPVSVDVRVKPDPSPDAAPTTNATFTIAATTQHPPLSYQWRMNGTNLLPSSHYFGITTPSLIVSNVTIADYGDYYCAVTDMTGTVPSASATLYPLVRPSILIHPATQTVPAFSAVPASVVLSNGFPPPYYFYWYRGSSNFTTGISSTKTNFVNISGLIVSNFASQAYTVRVTNRAATAFILSNSANFTLFTIADTDLDGMPDSYEMTYSGSPTDFAPGLDADGDGVSNLAEFLAGTDPSDPNSYLKIEQAFTPGGVAIVKFAAVSNRTYTVQYTDVLPGNWQKLADVVSRPSNRLEVFIDPGSYTNRFYRTVVPRQP